jgi:diadenosine tetraphosphatase ApaH/serine/threonine PP2A family protein phosphatase
MRFLHPEDTGGTFDLTPDEKYIINVGSVGQPRDGDAVGILRPAPC